MRLHFPKAMLRLAAAALLLALAGQASAGARALPTLTPAQHDQLAKLFSSIEARLGPALAADPKRRAAMEGELGKIAAMPPGKARIEAGRQYRARHADYYADALKKAGVDLALLARELERILPGQRFTATRDHMILGEDGGTDVPSSKPAPAPKVEVLRLLASNSGRCGGPSGGRVEHTSGGMTAHATSAIAAVCRQEGRYSADLQPGAATSMEVAYRFRTDLAVEAIGIPGIAIAKATARADGNGRMYQRTASAVALLLWYAPSTAGEDVERVNGLPTTIRTFTLSTIAETSGIALGGSVANARMSGIHAELRTTP